MLLPIASYKTRSRTAYKKVTLTTVLSQKTYQKHFGISIFEGAGIDFNAAGPLVLI